MQHSAHQHMIDGGMLPPRGVNGRVPYPMQGPLKKKKSENREGGLSLTSGLDRRRSGLDDLCAAKDDVHPRVVRFVQGSGSRQL